MPTKKSPKKGTAKPRKIEVVLKIQSLHPSLPAPVAAETVAGSSAELVDHFRAKYGEVWVAIERQRTFPVDPITQASCLQLRLRHR
jgi:hypothetical protein